MNQKVIKNVLQFLAVSMLISLMSGCGTKSLHHSSSAVEYLYPDKQEVQTPQVPALALPLKVGIAFAPNTSRYGRSGPLTENDKINLLKEIAEHFKKYEFVHSIEMIPSAYLRPKGGFSNLDQIHTMYGVDVIALVSYDQHQFTDEGIASLSYWTIIGAYIIPGEKNDTHTMVDTVVYDIKSRKLLFRAPGVSHIRGLATPVNLSEELREDSIEGFKLASQDLVPNLDMQLRLFKEKVKASPQEYKITHSPGYTGGGSVDGLLLLLMGIAGGYGLWSRRRQD
ncbi:MAG: rhombotarget lipoprotein [Campylobacterota bacterium]|nr:rhombotarget lipoprotein [Campylobacterota bacterium]